MAQHFKPSIDSDVVRVFVLETDAPHPDTRTERGSFGEILHEHFSRAGGEHHPPIGVETGQEFVVTEKGGRMPKVDEFDDYDGLLITGSMYDAHGDDEWIIELLGLLKGMRHFCLSGLYFENSPCAYRPLAETSRLSLHRRLLRSSNPHPSSRRQSRPIIQPRLGTRPLLHHSHARRPTSIPNSRSKDPSAPDAPGPSHLCSHGLHGRRSPLRRHRRPRLG